MNLDLEFTLKRSIQMVKERKMAVDRLERDCPDCQNTLAELDHAEREAWNALSRYKFQMFGYWAAIWVHLNRLSKARRRNPWSALVKMSTTDSYQQSPLARAVAKARGDILTEADMKANIDFLNDAAGKIKAFSSSSEQPESLQLLIEFRDHLDRRISELSSPSSPPETPQPAPDAEGEWYADRRWVVDKSTTMFRAECKDEATAARIVSDHAQAAAVPKLVEALRDLMQYTAGLELILTAERIKFNGGGFEAAAAALASAQIQEKQ